MSETLKAGNPVSPRQKGQGIHQRIQQVVRLEERLKEIEVRQAQAAAKQRVLLGRRERKDDTRRKNLVGAVVLAKVDQGVIGKAELRTWLEGALTRPADRALFDL